MQSVIKMVLKLLFLPQNCKNYPAAGALPSGSLCDTLGCIGLFSTGPKESNFCAKTFTFGSSLLSLRKTLVTLLVGFTLAGRFSSDFTGRIRNELINAARIVRLFFQTLIQNYSSKVSVFACKSSVYFSVPSFSASAPSLRLL